MEDSDTPPLKRQRRDSASIINPCAVSWRDAVCDALGLDDSIADEALQEALNLVCKASIDKELKEIPPAEPHYRHLYRIRCAKTSNIKNAYEDPPILRSTDGRDIHLSANILITDFDRYVQRNPGISFIVIQEFICCKASPHGFESNPIEPTNEWRESILIASEHLYKALLNLNTQETPSGEIPVFEIGQESPHWDFWAFYNRSILQTLPSFCNGIEKQHALVFSEYFCKTKLPNYSLMQKLISAGCFTLQSLGYLFVPGNVIVVKSPRGESHDMCYELTDWPSYFDQWKTSLDNSSTTRPSVVTSIGFKLSSWQFDGNFMESSSTHTCKITIEAKDNPITSLSTVPFMCLTAERQTLLLRRGEMFWKCRKLHYISYEGWDFEHRDNFGNSRFVVDPALSKKCYQYNPRQPTEPHPDLTDDIGAEAMERAEPPSTNFLLTMPPFIWGFSMQDKRWKKLSISNVDDVDWDEKAFDNLVIDPDTKDVIQALITHKVQNSTSTDLLRGKGSGLILLFHGPPGTGKALTAESVAEHAKKPLYRVTCGDIGTNPEAVEQDLKNMLILAKAWDCVVLLDEAEVFLQERSLKDIQRNALVSVFLRTLEYYDGILILTSNRVGTFDEGFRSRIQLAIHYPQLEQADRRKVWENFVNRLSSDKIASADIDIRNLRSNLTELSKFNLNGREIRNAINVARPLAKSEERKVDFESLRKVIKVQQKFDTYMKNVNEGLDDEEVAREEGKR